MGQQPRDQHATRHAETYVVFQDVPATLVPDGGNLDRTVEVHLAEPWTQGMQQVPGDAVAVLGISLNETTQRCAGHDAQIPGIGPLVFLVGDQRHNVTGADEGDVACFGAAGVALVALVATDDRYLGGSGLTLNVLKGVVPLDTGAYDIPFQVVLNERGTVRRIAPAFGESAAGREDASPIAHVASGKSIPPFLLVHAGTRQMSEIQTKHFAEALTKAAVPVQVYHARDKNHVTLNRELGMPGDESTRRILEFFDEIRAHSPQETAASGKAD